MIVNEIDLMSTPV